MIAALGVALGGLVLGAAGSGHCAVMCGPLVALANPRGRDSAPPSSPALALHAVLYHGGRLATYVALGALIGLSGTALSSAGFGRVLAVAAAIAVLIQSVAAWHTFRGGSHNAFGALITRALGQTGAWMRRHRISGPAAFGALTGLLPCGLVYAALTATAGLGSVTDGALFMGMFGLGTVPLLATVGMSAHRIERHLPAKFKKLAPLALAAVALLLIIRATGGHMDHTSRPQPTSHQHSM